jgi:ABC-type polar amino acid transport system ATPase subunit
MKNVDMQIKDGKLVITVDLSKQFGPSSSGKSTIIASTEGNASIPGREEIKIGLNVYQKP